MNIWAFRPSVFSSLETAIADHDESRIDGEIFLPDVVAAMVESGAIVRVLPSDEACFGLTYAEDLDVVRSAL
jgi:hypothetical protein